MAAISGLGPWQLVWGDGGRGRLWRQARVDGCGELWLLVRGGEGGMDRWGVAMAVDGGGKGCSFWSPCRLRLTWWGCRVQRVCMQITGKST